MQNNENTASTKAEPKVYKIVGEGFEQLAALDDAYHAQVKAANERLQATAKEEDEKVNAAHRALWQFIEDHLQLPKDAEHELNTSARSAGVFLVREKKVNGGCDVKVISINLDDLIKKAVAEKNGEAANG